MRNIFKEIKTKVQFQKRATVDYFAHIHEDVEVVFVKKGRATAFVTANGMNFVKTLFFWWHRIRCITIPPAKMVNIFYL